MIRVIIALGSNTRQAAHIQWATQRVASLLANSSGDGARSVRLSRTIWTSDYCGTGSMYMNRLIIGDTDFSCNDLILALKNIESETGRTHGQVTIDLDLMQYGTIRYHEKDWSRSYIQQLITDVI